MRADGKTDDQNYWFAVVICILHTVFRLSALNFNFNVQKKQFTVDYLASDLS